MIFSKITFRSLFLRKCLLVVLIILFTILNLSLKSSNSNNQKSSFRELNQAEDAGNIEGDAEADEAEKTWRRQQQHGVFVDSNQFNYPDNLINNQLINNYDDQYNVDHHYNNNLQEDVQADDENEDHIDFGSVDGDVNINKNIKYPKLVGVDANNGAEDYQADEPLQVDEDGKLYFPFQINPRTHDVQTLVFVTPGPEPRGRHINVNTPNPLLDANRDANEDSSSSNYLDDDANHIHGVVVDANHELDANSAKEDDEELNILRESIIRRKDKVSLRKLRNLLEFIKQRDAKPDETKWPSNERWPGNEDEESINKNGPNYRSSSVFGQVNSHGLDKESKQRHPSLYNWKSIDDDVQSDGHSDSGINWDIDSEERKRKVRSKSSSGQKEEIPKEMKSTANKTSKVGVTHVKNGTKGETNGTMTTTPNTLINLVPGKKIVNCEMPAYLEFPPDLFGQNLRKHGFVLVHICVVCYMFYCLAVVCDNYFLPALEECAERLGLSDDVAGATFMAAGSSAPELFTALLGVFIAKGDVGTGTIVGSAVFNILFVIGLCGVFTASAKLNWWPVLRDSSYYALAVLVLILCIYDGEVGTIESSIMLIMYIFYIVVMKFNVLLREIFVSKFPVEKWGLESDATAQTPDDDTFGDNTDANYGSTTTKTAAYQSSFDGAEQWHQRSVDTGWTSQTSQGYQTVQDDSWNTTDQWSSTPSQQRSSMVRPKGYLPPTEDPRKYSLFEAANAVIIKHKRLFRARRRFIAAANLIIIKNNKSKVAKRLKVALKAGPSKAEQKRMISQVRQDTVIGNRKPSIAPEPNEWLSAPNPLVVGWLPVIQWSLTYPLNAALYYTIPDCKKHSKLFLLTFFMAVFWTAILSYVMVWMVVLIGFTFGIPDSVMGITFLAAGTSIPDAYASIHVARAGQADMAVSNSIGSNVFDILIGLALPWFIETAIVYPGTTAVVKSMGLAYAVVLLFLTLIITVVLIHKFNWILCPKLGYSLLTVYAVFLIVSVALEFNLLGTVNPPACDV